MQFRIIVVTDPPTHTHTQNRQDQLQYTALQLAHSVKSLDRCYQAKQKRFYEKMRQQNNNLKTRN